MAELRNRKGNNNNNNNNMAGMIPSGFQPHYSLLAQGSEFELESSFPTGKPLSSEEANYVQKKCKRCGVFYTEMNNKTCRYHPGTFDEFKAVTQGAAIGWSCCRHLPQSTQIMPGIRLVPILSEAALQKNCPGCQVTDMHLEDENYSRMVSAFPFDKEAAKNASVAVPQADTPSPQPTKKTEQPDENADFFVHEIQEGDTLTGICLKYDVPKDELKRLNKITTNDIWHLKRVYIPAKGRSVSPSQLPMEDSLAWKKRNFKQKTGASKEEIDIYLAESNGNLEEAIKAYQEDVKWEKTQQKK